MSQAFVLIDSGSPVALSSATVFPTLPGAVTGTGNAVAGQTTLADLVTYIGTADGPFIMTAATATPSAFTSTTFEGFSSTTLGAALMGYGSTNDVTLLNRAGAAVIGITANTTGVTMAGALAITGALSGVTTAAISTSATVTSASAVALAVGLAGATNPAFVVDSSTGSQAAGLKVTGATAAGNVAVAVISSGAAANLLVDAKGTGTIGIGTVSTGAVSIVPILGATLKCMVSTTGGASINFGDAGTAPTSPNNGDAWIESDTLKIRLGGATVTVQTA